MNGDDFIMGPGPKDDVRYGKDRMTIDEILEAAEKATPGPWTADIRVGCITVYPGDPWGGCIENGRRRLAYFSGKELKNPDGTFNRWTVDEQDEYDALLIAGAPQLSAEVHRLRERERLLTEALENILYLAQDAAETYAENWGNYRKGIQEGHFERVRKARAALAFDKPPIS